jgi:hypothetical protein
MEADQLLAWELAPYMAGIWLTLAAGFAVRLVWVKVRDRRSP